MRHVEIALNAYNAANGIDTPNKFIEIENATNEVGVSPIVKFTIQSDSVTIVGVNGCQAVDILEYTKHLFQSLNATFPCRENALTITKIEEALHWQEARTKDRTRKFVEGKNQP
jgi:hypothetical protein